MLSRNLYILAGTLCFFALMSYILAFTGLAHEPGSPADDSLWRTIAIILLLIALVIALMAVLQTMFEQADRRTPGGQAGVRRSYLERKAAAEQARNTGKDKPPVN